jgi:hypothetical protein
MLCLSINAQLQTGLAENVTEALKTRGQVLPFDKR